MEFLDIGDGTRVRLDKITAVRTTTEYITGQPPARRITFYTTDRREWITSDQKAIEFIEDFFLIRTFQRRS